MSLCTRSISLRQTSRKIIGSKSVPRLRICSIMLNCSLERLNKLTFCTDSPLALLDFIGIVHLVFTNPTGERGVLFLSFALIWLLMNFNSLYTGWPFVHEWNLTCRAALRLGVEVGTTHLFALPQRAHESLDFTEFSLFPLHSESKTTLRYAEKNCGHREISELRPFLPGF